MKYDLNLFLSSRLPPLLLSFPPRRLHRSDVTRLGGIITVVIVDVDLLRCIGHGVDVGDVAAKVRGLSAKRKIERYKINILLVQGIVLGKSLVISPPPI